MTDKINREQFLHLVNETTKKLADEGLLITAGWVGFQMMVLPANATPAQINVCRMAFMTGAQHLFSSMLAIMDPGTEPTEKDLHKMDLIDKELEAFAREMHRRMDEVKS
jgi:hypothetical protein